MAKQSKPTITLPPFPALEWDGHFWAARIVLPSWAGFQCRHPGEATGPERPADGAAELHVASPGDEDAKAPSPEQVRSYRYLLEHEAHVQAAVLQAIFKYYPGERDLGDEEDELMPDIERPEELRSLIELDQVHVLDVSKNKVAYVGFEFCCTWDAGHGAGVMTHRGWVVATGQADVSFLEWIAKGDAKQRRKPGRKKS
jgi:hypothetical protein